MRVGQRLGQERNAKVGHRTRQRARRALPHLLCRRPQRALDGNKIVLATTQLA
jgi:hypothetical protein